MNSIIALIALTVTFTGTTALVHGKAVDQFKITPKGKAPISIKGESKVKTPEGEFKLHRDGDKLRLDFVTTSAYRLDTKGLMINISADAEPQIIMGSEWPVAAGHVNIKLKDAAPNQRIEGRANYTVCGTQGKKPKCLKRQQSFWSN